ncbi:unnamed protein product [Chrysodeixis includens]|uniref:Uncharacterized protein n=1 Tax=Chrysodeixis includens TaxID=689277 RepID=A0A9N8KU82_CHRIL|nr:unnamed protein product [Chrysodeixis includens]
MVTYFWHDCTLVNVQLAQTTVIAGRALAAEEAVVERQTGAVVAGRGGAGGVRRGGGAAPGGRGLHALVLRRARGRAAVRRQLAGRAQPARHSHAPDSRHTPPLAQPRVAQLSAAPPAPPPPPAATSQRAPVQPLSHSHRNPVARSWQALACAQGALAQRSALRSDSALPAACSQYTPLYPGAQVQLRWSAPAVQSAPFWQTPASQAASSAAQSGARPGAPW